MDKISLFHGRNFAISELSQYIEYDFLKEDHQNNFHTKNQEDSQQRFEVIGQILSKLSILVKNGLMKKFHHIIIFGCMEYDFHKEDHNISFYTKNYENLQRRLKDIGQKHSKNGYFGQKWPNFNHFWPYSLQSS